VSTRWPGLLERVRNAFEARDDVDPCARVSDVGWGVREPMEVMLPDGRSAARVACRDGRMSSRR